MTIIGCQKEEPINDEIEEIYIENSVKTKKVTLTDIKQNHELKKTIEQIEKRFDYNIKNNTNSRINSTDGSFAILTEEIIQVSTDSTDAYTFRIETPTHEDSDFENFVISRLYNNDFQFHIYRYKFPEIMEENEDMLIVSREQVNEDQINIGDFNEFINNKMFYDYESHCLLDIKSLGGILYIDILYCNILMIGGGNVTGGGGMIINGNLPSGSDAYINNCGEPYSIYENGECYLNCSLIDENGQLMTNDSGHSLQYVVEVPCNDNNASNNDYNSGSGSSGATGGGTGNTSDSETNNNEAGGSGTPYDNDTTTSNDSTNTVGVLPSEMDVVVSNFFDSLNENQRQFLHDNFGVRTEIRRFLEDNYNPHWDLGDDSPIPMEIKNFVYELIEVANQDTEFSLNTFKFVLEAKNQNKIYSNFNFSFLNSVNDILSIDSFDVGIKDQIWIDFTIRCAVLRENHPEWCSGLQEWQCDLKIFYEASKDLVHLGLDVFGLVPVIGEVADLTNGVLYTIEGDGVNATLSYASAVPIYGWAAMTVKYAVKVVDGTQTAYSIGTKVKLTWRVLSNGSIYFGSSSKLRKVLGMAPLAQDSRHAHHLIPRAQDIINHNIVQKAAKSQNAFHIDEALNGIPVEAWRNQPNHDVYNSLIIGKLDEFNNLYPNANFDESYDFVSDLISDVRDWVISNPNSHLNDIVLP